MRAHTDKQAHAQTFSCAFFFFLTHMQTILLCPFTHAYEIICLFTHKALPPHLLNTHTRTHPISPTGPLIQGHAVADASSARWRRPSQSCYRQSMLSARHMDFCERDDTANRKSRRKGRHGCSAKSSRPASPAPTPRLILLY